VSGPKDRWFFGIAIAYVLLAALNFSRRHSRYGDTLSHYTWLIWLLFAAVFFYRSYRPPDNEPE
jgi:hypothetical protein